MMGFREELRDDVELARERRGGRYGDAGTYNLGQQLHAEHCRQLDAEIIAQLFRLTKLLGIVPPYNQPELLDSPFTPRVYEAVRIPLGQDGAKPVTVYAQLTADLNPSTGHVAAGVAIRSLDGDTSDPKGLHLVAGNSVPAIEGNGEFDYQHPADAIHRRSDELASFHALIGIMLVETMRTAGSE